MNFKTKQLLFSSVFCALTAICAQLVIPIPAGQVQISMSLFGVFLCGALLSPKYSSTSMLAYILIGACGLPVFGRLSGGLAILSGPTGGYILSYPFITIIISFFSRDKKSVGFLKLFLSMLASLFVCYLFGSAYLALLTKTTFISALLVGALPFIIFDIIKAAIAAYIALIILKHTKSGLF